MFEPYEANPEAAEEEAYEDELAWRIRGRLTEQVGEMWGKATFYVVPEPPGSSWAQALLLARLEEVRTVLEGQVNTED